MGPSRLVIFWCHAHPPPRYTSLCTLNLEVQWSDSSQTAALLSFAGMARALRTIIMGAPGAGKGTISSRLVDTFQLVHLSSGDMLRRHIDQQTSVGLEAKEYIAKGLLVPDSTVMNIVLKELEEHYDRSWLLDGFPRTLSQVHSLLSEVSPHAVINLNVPFETIIERVRGRWIHPPSGRVYNDAYSPPQVACKDDVTGEPLVQRPDDHPRAVQERLQLYESQTKPVLNYFNEKGVLRTFTGTKSDILWPQIRQFVEDELLSSSA